MLRYFIRYLFARVPVYLASSQSKYLFYLLVYLSFDEQLFYSLPLLFVYLLRLANNYVPIRLVCLLRLTSTTKYLYASVRIPSSFIYYTYLLYLLYALMVEEESWIIII